MELLDAVLAAKIAKGPPGSEVTPASIVNATANMNAEQKSSTRTNLGVPSNSDTELYGSVSIFVNANTEQNLPADEILFNPSSAVDQSVLLIEGDQSQNVILRGVASPTANNDAATKQYVDNLIGSNSFIITVTYDALNDVYTGDKTFDEIEAAYTAGKSCVVLNGSSYAYLSDYDTTMFVFIRPYIDDHDSPVLKLAAEMFCVEDSNDWTVYDQIVSAPESLEFYDASSTSITLAAQVNTEYHYGELTSLTVSSFPAQGKFWIWFTSGSTATVVTGIDNPDGTPFAPEASKVYKITVENGYATYDSWSTT